MALGLIGKKVGMTQIFSPEGEIIPVTVLQVGPCAVVQKKTVEKDGYQALQLGFAEKKAEKFTKPLQGHCKKAGDKVYAVLKEFRTPEIDKYEVGDEITASIFETGESVVVSGTSKGSGFAGNIKRWGFSRGPMSHGSKFHRVVGSIGASAYPAKVFKGKKMPGHLGSRTVSVRGLQIVDKNDQEHIILVRGAVPGARNGLVTVRKA